MTVKNATELVVLVENTLGWVPDESLPLWKARAIQAGRLNKAIAKKPGLLTWTNLELAVEYLRRRRQPVTSPFGITYFVAEALKDANEVIVRPIGELVDEAIATEQSQRTPGWDLWVGRLTRAQGDGRLDVLAEWSAARTPTEEAQP